MTTQTLPSRTQPPLSRSPAAAADSLVCVPPGILYLNNAGRGPVLRRVASAAQAHFGPGEDPEGPADTVEALRGRVARLIGAQRAEEIVFAASTTSAINIVACGLKWSPGDDIVVSDAEHGANFIPWLALQEKWGVSVTPVPLSPQGVMDLAAIRAAVRPSTRLVAMPHVSHLYGTEQPVAEICAWLRAHSIACLVDGAQAVGRLAVDVTGLGCDFYTFSTAKGLLGLPGLGVLYARHPWVEQITPSAPGTNNSRIQRAPGGEPHYHALSGPTRLEPVAPPLMLVSGMRAALEQIESTGIAAIETRVRALGGLFAERLMKLGRPLVGDPPRRVGILAWPASKAHAQALALRLAGKNKIWVGAGQFGSGWALERRGVEALVRVSPHYFNTEADAVRLEHALQEIV
jgi:cysteine desulfurase / selenocysteine lyase